MNGKHFLFLLLVLNVKLGVGILRRKMPYKTKEARMEYYWKHRDEINNKRLEYTSKPEIRKRISVNDKIWRDKNRDKIRENDRVYGRNYRNKNKLKVINHYGNKCSCCGESNILFLSIDHVDGGGEKHRKKIGRHICNWLVKNNFPIGYQTLCFNCNWGRYKNGGICPHKTSLSSSLSSSLPQALAKPE